MILTHHPEDGDQYSDASGRPIKERIAKAVILNNFVVAERDSLFDLTPQSWRARKP
jgi:hypothetical protein